MQFGRDRQARGRWTSRLLLGGLVVATGIALIVHAGAKPARHRAAVAPPPPPVRVLTVGHPLLGVTAGFDLFGRGPDDLIRIQFAQGRITLTYVPTLASGNPQVSLLVGGRETVIRSFDQVPGYVVPDGGQAKALTGALAGGGPFVPGPGQQSAWVLSGSPTVPFLSLVNLSGRKLGPTIHFQVGSPILPATSVSDGRGDVLLTDGDANAYDAGPGWFRPLAGNVTAVGPADWLLVTCHAEYEYLHCRNESYRPSTRTRRVLPGSAAPGYLYLNWPPTGVTSPDGAIAAIPESNRDGRVSLHLISLRSGADRKLNLPLRSDPLAQSMAWSPDGRWLFVAAADDRIFAVRASSGQVESLGISLPPVTQLAIRPAPAGQDTPSQVSSSG